MLKLTNRSLCFLFRETRWQSDLQFFFSFFFFTTISMVLQYWFKTRMSSNSFSLLLLHTSHLLVLKRSHFIISVFIIQYYVLFKITFFSLQMFVQIMSIMADFLAMAVQLATVGCVVWWDFLEKGDILWTFWNTFLNHLYRNCFLFFCLFFKPFNTESTTLINPFSLGFQDSFCNFNIDVLSE